MEQKDSNHSRRNNLATVERWKKTVAEFLEQQNARLSPFTRKVIAGIMGLFIAGASFMLIITSLRQHGAGVFPTEILAPIKTMPIQQSPLSREEYEMLRKFKQSMDSLRRYDPVFCDEVLKDHTGLLDTINFLLSLQMD